MKRVILICLDYIRVCIARKFFVAGFDIVESQMHEIYYVALNYIFKDI